tara:strand:+ start:464 stop:715 length:252 start_codon:yes stop_codon:yes gene_type:complete
MNSQIRVYLFPDINKYLQEDEKVISTLEKDTHTSISFVKKKRDSFYIIEGNFEDIHQARIILQDIEKRIYKDSSYEKNNSLFK